MTDAQILADEAMAKKLFEGSVHGVCLGRALTHEEAQLMGQAIELYKTGLSQLLIEAAYLWWAFQGDSGRSEALRNVAEYLGYGMPIATPRNPYPVMPAEGHE